MLPIPDDILKSFNAIMEKKAISAALRADYRKWLMYYLDFRRESQTIWRRLFACLLPVPAILL